MFILIKPILRLYFKDAGKKTSEVLITISKKPAFLKTLYFSFQ